MNARPVNAPNGRDPDPYKDWETKRRLAVSRYAQFWPWHNPRQWPRDIIEKFYKPHRGHLDRLNLLCFWIGNGLPKLQASQLIHVADTFDPAANRHLYTILKDAERYVFQNRYWDMQECAYIYQGRKQYRILGNQWRDWVEAPQEVPGRDVVPEPPPRPLKRGPDIWEGWFYPYTETNEEFKEREAKLRRALESNSQD